ncbi:class I SAM-dependent methyltransferase [Streptacidiphilus sp. MAP5-3]|uniref:class I SAM-dependent methyltransferase n=1 Tax=unclassified Streptacidiphilus TaxID=2643834 RepID=UPI00351924A2
MSDVVSEADRVERTRGAYDTVAETYAAVVPERFEQDVVGRAMLAAFAERVAREGELALPVADVGCGPGHVTAHLHALGLPMLGVDLSPEMVRIAEQRHPEQRHPQLRFEVGEMARLDLADASLGGLVSWWSLVHTAPDQLPAAFAEFHRVLVPGGQLLLGFHGGTGGRKQLDCPYGHDVDLVLHRHRAEDVAAQLGKAGFTVDARLVQGQDPTRTSVCLLAYKSLLADKPMLATAE